MLAENARRLAEGKALAAPIRGSDELGRLDPVFHAMAKSLDENDRENEMFIYSVSHDLRSPLVNLQGFSQELSLRRDDLRRRRWRRWSCRRPTSATRRRASSTAT